MDKDDAITPSENAESHERLIEFRAITSVEGKIPSQQMVDLFARFEAERWPHERRRMFIVESMKDSG